MAGILLPPLHGALEACGVGEGGCGERIPHSGGQRRPSPEPVTAWIPADSGLAAPRGQGGAGGDSGRAGATPTPTPPLSLPKFD